MISTLHVLSATCKTIVVAMGKMPVPEQYDLAKEGAPFRAHFVLWPRYWNAYGYKRKLTWSTVQFLKPNRLLIPKRSGVYAFLVLPGVAPELGGAYIMYIGETQSLHERFGDYLLEAQGKRERSHMYKMFRNYPDHLYFSFAEVPIGELKNAEDALQEALWPPMCIKLPATISGIRRMMES